ncbi:hypothetical protein CkaCkLH20_10545 [Colletotrichum karsti]|uniref:Uncharacterized protein n=1 Tax=Colletotrichum karsti TaxID=1095194 RepID=A0A9P6HV62_9PEZI|nr:uncharacterized protein CkaCkLH20_10545 [Colletotrichum karsti]KAF9871913.1 hypothetical protein CkaCkLH20_10545 [Colletotrichum karsti]
MSKAAKRAALQRFSDNKILDLIPHPNLGRPHGTNDYSPLPEEDSDGNSIEETIAKYPGGFDPEQHTDNREHARVQILKQVYGGLGESNVQCFLGKILVEPANDTTAVHARLEEGSHVLVKVIDHVLFESDALLADSQFTREGAALNHFYKNKLTGPDHIIPEFFGTWVLKVEERRSVRCVGIVLTEFVQGVSIRALSTFDKESEMFLPKENPVSVPKVDGGTISLTMKAKTTRLRFLKQLLGESVKHLKAGIERDSWCIHRILVTNLEKGTVLRHPRPVLLHLSFSQVYSLTKWPRMRGEPPTLRFEELSRPIHPFEVFDLDNIANLEGWLPPEWVNEPYKYDGWLLLEFGVPGQARRHEASYSTYDEKPELLDAEEHARRKERLDKAIEYCDKLKQYALQRPGTRYPSRKRRGPEQEPQAAKRIRGDESSHAGRESLRPSSPSQSPMSTTSCFEVNDPQDGDHPPGVGHEPVHDEWFLFYNGGPKERSQSE